MGRRVIFAVVLLGALAAGGQAWLMTAMLSRPLASGQTGWQRATTATRPKPGRRSDMAYITLGEPRSEKGCTTILPGESYVIDVTAHQASMQDGTHCNMTCSYDDGQNEPYGYSIYGGSPPSWPQVGVIGYAPTSASRTLYVRVYGEDFTDVLETHEVSVAIDTTTKPTITPVSLRLDCGPSVTVVADIDLYRAYSWSWRVLDGDGNTVSGGTQTGPSDFSELGYPCTARVGISSIPASVSSSDPKPPLTLEVTATNPNGTTTSNITLPTPQGNTVSLSASPASTTAGQAVTLNWSVTAADTAGAGTASASISGVGPLELDDSQYPNYHGTVIVYPTETTTYTISSWNDCLQATDSATVEITPTPRVPMGTVVISRYQIVADVRTPTGTVVVSRYQIREDVRTPTRVVLPIRFAIREDVRTPTRVVLPIQFSIREDVRTPTRVVLPIRYTIRELRTPTRVVLPIRFQVFAKPKLHLMAEDTATGLITELGTIDPEAAPLEFPDVAIAPGTYRMWVEGCAKEGLYWHRARPDTATLVTIADGQPPIQDLPWAADLAANVSMGLTTITWTSEPMITGDEAIYWGVWFSPESPVDLSDVPDDRQRAVPGQDIYLTVREQTGDEWVAVAAYDATGKRGRAVELYLPWSTDVPASPPNQTAQG